MSSSYWQSILIIIEHDNMNLLTMRHETIIYVTAPIVLTAVSLYFMWHYEMMFTHNKAKNVHQAHQPMVPEIQITFNTNLLVLIEGSVNNHNVNNDPASVASVFTFWYLEFWCKSFRRPAFYLGIKRISLMQSFHEVKTRRKSYWTGHWLLKPAAMQISCFTCC